MKAFASFISSLPFAGKLIIRPHVHNIHQSSDRMERFQHYINFLLLMFVFVFWHTVQAVMGFQVFTSTVPYWFQFIGIVYGIVNASIMLTQLYIVYRVRCFYKYARYPRYQKGYTEDSIREALIMLIVTVGGQAAFFVPYNLYN